MRRLIASAVAVLFAITLATAEDIGGNLTKIEDGKATYIKGGKGGKKGKKGEPATLEIAKGVTYNTGTRVFDKEAKKATYTKEKDLTEADVKDLISKAGEKGIGVRLITADDGDNKGKVIEIRVLQAKKKAAG
jgi:hypothetical protein